MNRKRRINIVKDVDSMMMTIRFAKRCLCACEIKLNKIKRAVWRGDNDKNTVYNLCVRRNTKIS